MISPMPSASPHDDGATTAPCIGIYAHHHGSGHLHRCREIARQLRQRGFAVTIFSSAAGADITLPDDSPADGQVPAWRATTAAGTVHYAPPQNAGLQQRFARLAQWIAEHKPAAFYVDVSAEVVSFVRLMGIPVATIAMPGVRDDQPHQTAYAQADAIIAAWPHWVPLPFYLTPHASRFHAIGGISRLEPINAVTHHPRRVVVMTGEGGSTWDPADWAQVQRACPDWEFIHLSGRNRVADPSELLAGAAVAVIAGGQNSIADLAVLGTPAIVLPQPRPFVEQNVTAKVLATAGLATVMEEFPAANEWPAILEEAANSTPRWERWETDGAAGRAADIIANVAHPAVRDESAAEPRTAVLTLTDHQRVHHVQNQVNLLPLGVDHITIALSDVERVRRALPTSTVVAAPSDNLAAARNCGARQAIKRGARRLIFLDADCVASNQLISSYQQALQRKPHAVVAGPVTYMKPGELRTTNPQPHPARPNPQVGELVKADNYDLFWSLSFALEAATWERIVDSFGGFDEGYQGYGGEDTDFASNLQKHNIELWWVGGAHAFHQWHPVSSPPWEHVEDIVTNATYFHNKWGRWPMEGWLREFAEAGAVEFTGGRWHRTKCDD